MKLSLQWLNDFIEVSDFFAQPLELAKKMIAAGFEVESVEDSKALYDKMVVGQVTVRGQHPDADRLTLCQVDVGGPAPLQIVCGARNHKAMDKVVVTLPGAKLPNGLEIKVSKIRGVESHGMLASEVELGLKAESEGILILDPKAQVGMPFAEHYGLDDVLLDVSVTPNRADCLSHLGMARELSAILNRPFKEQGQKVLDQSSLPASPFKVQVDSPELCPAYCGQVMEGIVVGPSPEWMKTRLQKVGLKPINNVVDTTNYVMLELGQPLHAFDLTKLKGQGLRVALAKEGESFESFDGSHLKLSAQDLTIRDEGGVVALAGVVGAKNSGVDTGTTKVFLESAFFARESVRRTARRLGVDTDSSQRFSKGIDPSGVQVALKRAMQLLSEWAQAKVPCASEQKVQPIKKPQAILVRTQYLSQRLGYTVTLPELSEMLKRLGCLQKSVDADKSALMIEPPAFRWDLEQEADFVEEYGRLKGYDVIPEAFPPLTHEPATLDKQFELENKLIGWLAGAGFNQAVHYAFGAQSEFHKLLKDIEVFDELGVEMPKSWVRVRNPISEELAVMRPSLLPALCANVVGNLRQGNETGRVFEVGSVFGAKGDGFFEPKRLALAAWGVSAGLWSYQRLSDAVWEVKAAVERLLHQLHIQKWAWKKPKKTPSLLHPEQTAVLWVEGRSVGFVGSLHPLLKEEWKLRQSVALAELDLDKLLRGQPRVAQAKKFSRFPAVDRDLALLVPTEVAAGDLVQEMLKLGAPLVKSAQVFDEFRGGKVADGEKSLAFRLRLQKMDATLDENEIRSVVGKVQEQVALRFKARLREGHGD